MPRLNSKPVARGGPVKGTPTPEPIGMRPQPPQASPPVDDYGTQGVGVLMIASMPSIASGADVYARQFYRGSTVPFRRYLPISL